MAKRRGQRGAYHSNRTIQRPAEPVAYVPRPWIVVVGMPDPLALLVDLLPLVREVSATGLPVLHVAAPWWPELLAALELEEPPETRELLLPHAEDTETHLELVRSSARCWLEAGPRSLLIAGGVRAELYRTAPAGRASSRERRAAIVAAWMETAAALGAPVVDIGGRREW